MGFFAAQCLQSYWIHFVVLMIIGTISLFAKFFTLLGALAVDTVELLEEFTDNFTKGSQDLTNKKRVEMKEKFIEIIQFHAAAKRY